MEQVVSTPELVHLIFEYLTPVELVNGALVSHLYDFLLSLLTVDMIPKMEICFRQ